MNPLSRRLSQLRADMNPRPTLEEIGVATGLSTGSVHYLLTGRRQNFTWDTVLRVSRALGLPETEARDLFEQMKTYQKTVVYLVLRPDGSLESTVIGVDSRDRAHGRAKTIEGLVVEQTAVTDYRP